jgi:hypothetical protein
MRGMKKILMAALLLSAFSHAQTIFIEPWHTDIDGWTFAQQVCAGPHGPATCNSGLTTDGNPPDAVFYSVRTKGGRGYGYFWKKLTWEQMGVPTATTVTTINDAKIDAKAVAGCTNNSSESTVEVDVWDRYGNLCTGNDSVPATPVAQDTRWTTLQGFTNQPIRNANCSASSSVIMLGVLIGLDAKPSKTCEIRVDNLKLTIASQ